MEHSQSKKLSFLNISVIFLFLAVLSLFFPIRHVFLSHFSFITGVYSDFTSFSLYLADIFLGLSGGFCLAGAGRVLLLSLKPLRWLTLWIFVVFLTNFALNKGESAYYLLKFLEMIVAYGTIVTLFKLKPIKTAFSTLFITLSTLQSLLALLQFYLQRPVGLFRLGEQQIYPNMQGIAKLVVDGTTYIRGYGTFPHPNLLSAFLVAGVLLTLYLFQTAQKTRAKAALAITLAINILGLTVTFSRAAFLALGIGLVIYFAYLLISKVNIKKIYISLAIIFASLLTSSIIFRPYLLTRATISGSASSQRIAYNRIGVEMIKEHPLFGVGLGESVPLMNEFSTVRLLPWDIQPIHNYFLLTAAETGIIGALILIWIFLSHLLTTYHKLRTSSNPFLYSLFAILSCFLVLMLFDHYFYTLQQTQILLWITLGLIAAETKKV